MEGYRFSPIQNKRKLIEAVEYVAKETTKLCKKITGKTFPISSLTVFSHYEDEYQNLVKILEELGSPYNENNGPRVSLYFPIKVEDNVITHVRIRKPDSERPQVGCNDFDTDYESFKKEYLESNTSNMRLIQRPEYEMIELFGKDSDVLAYVVSR